MILLAPSSQKSNNWLPGYETLFIDGTPLGTVIKGDAYYVFKLKDKNEVIRTVS